MGLSSRASPATNLLSVSASSGSRQPSSGFTVPPHSIFCYKSNGFCCLFFFPVGNALLTVFVSRYLESPAAQHVHVIFFVTRPATWNVTPLPRFAEPLKQGGGEQLDIVNFLVYRQRNELHYVEKCQKCFMKGFSGHFKKCRGDFHFLTLLFLFRNFFHNTGSLTAQ